MNRKSNRKMSEFAKMLVISVFALPSLAIASVVGTSIGSGEDVPQVITVMAKEVNHCHNQEMMPFLKCVFSKKTLS